MASAISGSEVYRKVKGYHKKAFEFINMGLEIDEKKSDPHSAVEYYKKGIVELKNGVAIDTNIIVDGKDREKLVRLQEKMKKNLVLAEDRMSALTKALPPARADGKDKKPGKTILDKPMAPRIESNKDSKINKKTTSVSAGENVSSTTGKKVESCKFRGLDKDMVNRILNEVVENKISVSFDDVAGNDCAKEAIKEIIIYPMLRPDLYTGLRAPTKGVLLFGPPGNGKSLLAKAVAYESKCVFFNITAASLMSKWVGESEKMVRALFTMARELQPCVIFMDEIDALLASRKSGDKDVNIRVLNEFLQEFDGARSSDTERILIMGATNRPFELDDAALRRFPKRIYIPLPNQDTRFKLLKLLLKKEGNPLQDHELMKIASLTENYSSHDLTCLAKEAALEPLRSLDQETFQSISSSEVRKLNFKDFQKSLGRVRPAVTSSSLKQFNDWNQEFGDISK